MLFRSEAESTRTEQQAAREAELAAREAELMTRVAELEAELGGRDAEPAARNPAPSLPDPILRDKIRACFERLPPLQRAALEARMGDAGARADKHLARGLEMTLNAFHQNLVRARRSMKACLETHGVSVP